MESTPSKELGLIEPVILKSKKGYKEILAKVDTGADNSSIDESLAIELSLGPIIDTTKIKSSHGESVRPVILCEFVLKNIPIKAEVNLVDRSHLKYPMLIGKDIISKYGFIVNPEEQPSSFVYKETPKSELTAAVISLGSTSSLWTLQEMTRYFKRVDNINLNHIEIRLDLKQPLILYEGKPFEKYDCVYVKGSFRYAEVLETVTRFLFNKCYMPIHPSAFSIVHDKLATHLVLQENKIPMPTTYFASSREAARKLLKSLNYPIIMKFPKGTQGRGVMFADSYTSANTILDALDTLKQPFIVQEYIETGGVDTRAIVLGDKVVAAMHRKAAIDDIRSNIHMGGLGEQVELDHKTKELCVKTARVLKAEICAVDLLEGPKGAMVIEANISPGLQGITKATKINVAHEIAKFLFKRTKEFKSELNNKSATTLFDELGLNVTEENGYKRLITQLDFKGNAVILPEVLLKLSKLNEKDDIVIKVREGELIIKRFLK